VEAKYHFSAELLSTMPTKVSERMKCIAYLFLPISFVKYEHEQEGL